MRSVHQCSVLFALVTVSLGCDEKQYDETKAYNNPVELKPRPEGDKQPVSRAATPLDSAQQTSTATKLAAARCDREQRCNNVGEGKKYASHAACMGSIASEWREELDDYNCPGGTVPGALDQCLTEIRKEGCLNPLASLERIVDCDTNEVCRNPDPRP